MRRVLVLGGTRFFGRRLVEKLIANGDQVTIASHNFSKVAFDSKVRRFSIERESLETLAPLANETSYDIVYDQICFSPTAADVLCKAFAQTVKKVIHTSTQSVYLSNGLQKECDFDPFSYPRKLGLRSEFNYGEAKRLAETIYFDRASFPVTAVRLPFVLGPDDYTGRLNFYIRNIREGKPILVENAAARTSLISANEAADFLFWVGQQDYRGPINAASSGAISLAGIVEKIEETVSRKATLTSGVTGGDISPYSQEHSRYLDTTLATDLGFRFSGIESWLPQLIRDSALT